MRALVQRVANAYVDVVADNDRSERVGEIGPGLCVLVGVTHADTSREVAKLADKLLNLRIFDDGDGAMNRSLLDVAAASRGADTAVGLLIVSQFTLYGDTSKGRRPGWSAAASPDHAEPLIDELIGTLRRADVVVESGRFRTHMQVGLVNDGPVTVRIDVEPPAPS